MKLSVVSVEENFISEVDGSFKNVSDQICRRYLVGCIFFILVENNCCDSELKKDNMSVINKGSFKRINGHRSEKWLLWADNSIKYVK